MIAWNFQRIVGTCQFRVPWFGYPCGYSSLTHKIEKTAMNCSQTLLLFSLILLLPVTSVVIFCAPAPIEMPSLADIVVVLLNVSFPAMDARPIGIIADTANAKVFYSDTNL